MIVIVEGIDRVGKTTLVEKLVKKGFINIKDEFVIDTYIHNFADYSIGKCESFVKVAQQLDEKGFNVVIDRLHLTEYVYGTYNRCSVNEKAIWAVDMMLANLNALLLYVKPSDIKLSNELAGVDQTKHDSLFDDVYKLSSMSKWLCDYNSLDQAVEIAMHKSCEYDFYFASPFFNQEQVEREERMIKHIRSLGFSVFSPKEQCHLNAKASQQARETVFSENCKAIRNSKAVFAVTDGKDVGTIWEAGYAYGIGTPVVYFAETLGDNKFNVMLAQSGIDTFLSQDEVTIETLSQVLNGVVRKYRGDIE